LEDILQFVARHGYAVLLLWVFAEQIGLPLPSAPFLLAAGALAATHRLHLAAALAVAVSAALTADVFWYWLGRTRGGKVVANLCRISLEPDSCSRRTQCVFARYGPRSLLVAKFIPWLSAAAAPLSGVFRMRLRRFLVYDVLGILLWASAYILAGYIFSRQLQRLAGYILAASTWLAIVILAGAPATYLLWKYHQRRRFQQELDMARISPEELKRKLDSGDPLTVIDLRHPLDVLASPFQLPGAVRVPVDQVEQRLKAVPPDRELVLYCT